MKKLTKSELIEKYKLELDSAYKIIYQMQEKADAEFANSVYCKQLKDKIDSLERFLRIEKETRKILEDKISIKEETIKKLMNEKEILKS